MVTGSVLHTQASTDASWSQCKIKLPLSSATIAAASQPIAVVAPATSVSCHLTSEADEPQAVLGMSEAFDQKPATTAEYNLTAGLEASTSTDSTRQDPTTPQYVRESARQAGVYLPQEIMLAQIQSHVTTVSKGSRRHHSIYRCLAATNEGHSARPSAGPSLNNQAAHVNKASQQ